MTRAVKPRQERPKKFISNYEAVRRRKPPSGAGTLDQLRLEHGVTRKSRTRRANGVQDNKTQTFTTSIYLTREIDDVIGKHIANDSESPTRSSRSEVIRQSVLHYDLMMSRRFNTLKRINIGDETFRIFVVRDVLNTAKKRSRSGQLGTKVLDAVVLFERQEILVSANLPEQQKWSALFHEMLHIALPQLSERQVLLAEGAMFPLLWKLGFGN